MDFWTFAEAVIHFTGRDRTELIKAHFDIGDDIDSAMFDASYQISVNSLNSFSTDECNDACLACRRLHLNPRHLRH
jgi:hypothetical protein